MGSDGRPVRMGWRAPRSDRSAARGQVAAGGSADEEKNNPEPNQAPSPTATSRLFEQSFGFEVVIER